MCHQRPEYTNHTPIRLAEKIWVFDSNRKQTRESKIDVHIAREMWEGKLTDDIDHSDQPKAPTIPSHWLGMMGLVGKGSYFIAFMAWHSEPFLGTAFFLQHLCRELRGLRRQDGWPISPPPTSSVFSKGVLDWVSLVKEREREGHTSFTTSVYALAVSQGKPNVFWSLRQCSSHLMYKRSEAKQIYYLFI